MAKFSIKANPTFTTDVSIPRVGGESIQVKFTFRVIGRTELAALYDKWADATKQLIDGEQMSFSQMTDADLETQTQQIKDIVVGWGFEDEFNDENILALVDSGVGVLSAILDQFHNAYRDNKSKN